MAQTDPITKRLDGKTAVVTGGSSGLGLATAQRFVDEGAYVFITGRRQRELDITVNQIGKHVTGVQGNVSNLNDLDRLVYCLLLPAATTCYHRNCVVREIPALIDT